MTRLVLGYETSSRPPGRLDQGLSSKTAKGKRCIVRSSMRHAGIRSRRGAAVGQGGLMALAPDGRMVGG